MIPKGVNIPMPRPWGGLPPTISVEPKTDGSNGKTISVQLVGEIGPITQYLELISILDSATESDDIRIMIDSPGGDVYTTTHLVGRIESCKGKVTTVARGCVASAATFLWFYAPNKEVDRWSRFMHHSSLHGDWGKSLALKENATELVNYMKSILTDEQKEGVLLAKEVLRILDDKADVEVSGATAKARLAAKLRAEAPTDPTAPVTDPTAVPSDPSQTPAEPAVTDPNATPAPTTTEPVAPVTDPNATPAPVDPVQTTDVPPTEGGEVVDLAKIFAEELGIESPDPVQTPVNDPAQGGNDTTSDPEPQPTTTQPVEAKKTCPKCGKNPCKCGVKNDGDPVDPTDPNAVPPATTTPAPTVTPAPVTPVDPAAQPAAPVEPTDPQPGTGEITPDPNAPVDPVTGKRGCCGGGKKKSKKAQAIAEIVAALAELVTEGDTAKSDVTVGEEPESVKPEQNKNPVEIGGDGKGDMKEGGQTEVVDLEKIFADEGLPGVGTGEGDPEKVDPNTTVVAPKKDADQNANVETVTKGPEARAHYYW